MIDFLFSKYGQLLVFTNHENYRDQNEIHVYEITNP